VTRLQGALFGHTFAFASARAPKPAKAVAKNELLLWNILLEHYLFLKKLPAASPCAHWDAAFCCYARLDHAIIIIFFEFEVSLFSAHDVIGFGPTHTTGVRVARRSTKWSSIQDHGGPATLIILQMLSSRNGMGVS
jgi:hypothetical protein